MFFNLKTAPKSSFNFGAPAENGSSVSASPFGTLDSATVNSTGESAFKFEAKKTDTMIEFEKICSKFISENNNSSKISSANDGAQSAKLGTGKLKHFHYNCMIKYINMVRIE